LQDEITGRIAVALDLELVEAEASRRPSTLTCSITFCAAAPHA